MLGGRRRFDANFKVVTGKLNSTALTGKTNTKLIYIKKMCFLTGDLATGSGVDRHMMSTVIFKLMSGFHINLG